MVSRTLAGSAVGEAERRADQPDPSDGAVAHQLDQAAGLGVVAVHERLHQQPALAVGDVEGLLHVGRAPPQRLLAKHVLAGLECADSPLNVHRVGERDVDGVDVRIGQQRVISAVCALDAVLGGVALGGLALPAGNGEDLERR